MVTKWIVGDEESTRQVAAETGVPVEKLNEMAANARAYRPPVMEYRGKGWKNNG